MRTDVDVTDELLGSVVAAQRGRAITVMAGSSVEGAPSRDRAILIGGIRRERTWTGKSRPLVHIIILMDPMMGMVLLHGIGQPRVGPTAAAGVTPWRNIDVGRRARRGIAGAARRART